MDHSELQVLEPTSAWDLIQKEPSALLVDVRSNMEFLFIGHPCGAINVPWIDEPDWIINPRFAVEIRKRVLGGSSATSTNQAVPILLICRSGKRSKEAGEFLLTEDFHKVFSIAGGFEGPLDDEHHRSTQQGWRFAGLPWEQC